MTATLERRLGAVEKRMGVSNRPLAALSDLDLLEAIRMLNERLAAEGNVDAIASPAQHDDEEARLRAYHERPDVARSGKPVLEDGARWPYLRARERYWVEHRCKRGPPSARTVEELWRKIEVAMAAMELPP